MTTSWFQRLLVDDVTESLRTGLTDEAKREVAAFMEACRAVPDVAEKATLDAWYESGEGQAVLLHLFQRLWAQMADIARWAMPAHDSRHAMYKVPATSIEYIQAERVRGYERVGVFGALLHDHGRWAEERIFGGPWCGGLHARLSFLLAREVMEDLPIPPLLRDQVLRAVAQHTKGATSADPMVTKLTVSPDREQLYGPEIILRLMHQVPKETGELAAILRSAHSRSSVLDRLMHFWANVLPGPLFSRQGHVDELRHILGTFILMSQDREASRAQFASVARAKLPPGFRFDRAWACADALRPHTEISVQEALRTFLAAPNRAAGAGYMAAALAKAKTVEPHQTTRVAGALEWARAQRVRQDLRQEQALRDARDWFREDALLLTITDRLLEGWWRPEMATA
ncbi:hypothetical protein P3W85_34940 [Cupriavidus basilensis]|uniref:Uncharacterized protein n=1 Tax=Cupriavidus basilensis TaxID=68895 RepID=A0ABT6AZP2_9BURK|nr:hypothetical protein [Cupriavidus basilensis]MDF3838094.1 hypothetical protein [Cupriavidus basilensis]